MKNRFLSTVVFCILVVGAVAQQKFDRKSNNQDHIDDKLESQNFQTIQELVKQSAPKVYLHSKERYKMSSVDWYLKRVSKEERVTDRNSLTGQEVLSYANGDTFKLLSEDVTDETITDDNLVPNNEDVVLSHKNKRVGYGWQFGAKCYVHIKPSYYQDIPPFFEHEIDIQYYYFYPLNGTALHHEGDWEIVIVKISPDGTIRKIGMSAHGKIKWYNPDQLSYQGTHPIVYAANKSHAFYENKGRYVPEIFTSPDQTNKGRAFKSWNNYEIIAINDSILNSSNNLPVQNNGIEVTNNWVNYTGKWGKKGANINVGLFGVHEYSKGPIGPKTYADNWNGKNTNRHQGYITPHLFGQYPDSLISGSLSIPLNKYSSYSINNLPSNTEIISWSVQSSEDGNLVVEQIASDDSNLTIKVKNAPSATYLDIIATVCSDYGSYKILDKVKKRIRVQSLIE